MAIIVISDLHLQEENPVIADLFLKFLTHEVNHADQLYILGDFFEAWIGDDDLTTFNQMIMRALRQVSLNGTPIYLMHGNRDFLIGKQFFKQTGCRWLPDEYIADIYQTPTLLMHGDSLCIDDIKYIQFRKKTRLWLVKKLFLMKSLKKRRALAKQYREASNLHKKGLSEEIMDVNQNEVEAVMQKHGVFHLIHGHTHRQAIHHFKLQQKPAERIVLGAWHTHGNALICRPDGQKEWTEID